MKPLIKFAAVVLGLVLIGLGIVNWYMSKPKPADVTPQESIQSQITPSPQVEPKKSVPQYPVGPSAPGQTPVQELPALQVSDTAMRKALSSLLGDTLAATFFYSNEIIRRIVVSIDNLPRENVSAQLLPLKPVAGQFLVKDDNKSIYLDPANYQRYRPYVDLVQNLDAKKLVALYTSFYPLFQQQYRELGYPDGYFNDRLVAVMDYVINFTEVVGPVQLVQQHVQYQFVDPDLEKMSAAGKLLTRIGHENTVILKSKLREIRAELVAQNK